MGSEVSIADGNSRPRRGLSQRRWRKRVCRIRMVLHGGTRSWMRYDLRKAIVMTYCERPRLNSSVESRARGT
jgi:hypothetical protein